MLRELDFIESDWAALFWALGSTTAIFRHSARGVLRWFGKRKRHEEEPMMKDMGKKAVGIVAGMVMAIGLGLCALGLLVLSFRLFPTWGLERAEWVHWLTVIVIPETICIIAVAALWQKRRPVALGILLSAIAMATHVVIHVASHWKG
jgi:hypothetical protein